MNFILIASLIFAVGATIVSTIFVSRAAAREKSQLESAKANRVYYAKVAAKYQDIHLTISHPDDDSLSKIKRGTTVESVHVEKDQLQRYFPAQAYGSPIAAS